MTNRQALAMNEYMKDESVDSEYIIKKFNLTKKEFWEAYAILKAKAPK